MREGLKEKRKALLRDDVLRMSDAILDRLTMASLIQGKHVACYLSHEHEVMAERVIPWLHAQGKQVYLPVLTPESRYLTFALYNAMTALAPNRYGILEPVQPCDTCSPDQLNTVLVPLVAFTAQCERLGMGAGYYDTTFAFLNQAPRAEKPRLIGLAYDFQCMPTLSQHPHDVALDAVVTETTIYHRV